MGCQKIATRFAIADKDPNPQNRAKPVLGANDGASGVAVLLEIANILSHRKPVLSAGIPCIDLIDLDYPYWHTIQDTPDKCSASSLGEIGRLLVDLIYKKD